jgi:hypothetical protein
LFWKKKSRQADNIICDSDCKRNAFRYEFKNNQGFTIRFRGRTLRVINISAGGLAFADSGFSPLDSDSVSFSLDIPNFRGQTDFSSELRIVEIDSDGICHAIFENCSPEQCELIHKYVLEMQKNDLAH